LGDRSQLAACGLRETLAVIPLDVLKQHALDLQ
jgi:hypothetical protein